MSHSWPWAVLALLGAYHGLNPAMGWLFALALGLQEKKRSAVWLSLLPIAAGHAAAIAVAVLLLQFTQQFLPIHIIKWGVAGILCTLGAYRLFRASHPRGSGMRVRGRELVVWSFLMASAHGAGLMVVPVLLSHPSMGRSHDMAAMIPTAGSSLSIKVVLLAVLVHTLAMLIVAGVLALVSFELYDRVGLRILRHTWLNFDLLWAIALLVAGGSVLWM
jgi:hypothetical protein